MQYVENYRVLMRILFAPRGCIPVELQGPARFAKLHSEIINVVRGSVVSTCSAGICTNKKKDISFWGGGGRAGGGGGRLR